MANELESSVSRELETTNVTLMAASYFNNRHFQNKRRTYQKNSEGREGVGGAFVGSRWRRRCQDVVSRFSSLSSVVVFLVEARRRSGASGAIRHACIKVDPSTVKRFAYFPPY